jgi:hypothetical protein
MGKLVILLPILLAIPWAIRTLWQMRRARGPKERAFLARTSLTGWMLVALASVVLSVLKGQTLLFFLPVIAVGGLAFQHASRKARARIQLEESDPLSRARPLN